ncbi:MAG: PTS transporter subunit EIIB [Fusobacteriaceae bacterium]
MEKEIEKLFLLLGGNENIKNLNHCMTRLRIEVKDEKLVDQKGLLNFKFARGVVQNGENVQIVIGVKVKDVYLKMKDTLSSQNTEKTILNSDKKQNNISFLSEMFLPMIPWILLTGMLIISSKLPYIKNISYIAILQDILIKYFPVAFGYSLFKYKNKNPLIGLTFGFMMVALNRSQNLLVLVIGLLILIKLEETLEKFIKDPFKILLVPGLSVLGSVVLVNLFIGPVLDSGLAIGINYFQLFLNSNLYPIIAFVFGITYSLAVKKGLHHILLFLDLQLVLSGAGTVFWPMVAISNVAQGSVTIGSSFKEVVSGLLAYVGITEPAMYGVNLKSEKRFYSALFSSGVGCGIAGIYRVKSMGIGPGGIPAILIVNGETAVGFSSAILATIVLGFILGRVTKNCR